MNTLELISLVGQFSFGRYNLTERDKNLYLAYLNIADFNLYQIIKNSSSLRKELILFFDDDKNYVNLPEDYIKKIFGANDRELLSDNKLFGFDVTNNFYYFDNKLYINKSLLSKKVDVNDGLNKSYVKLVIIPKKKKLVLNIINPNSELTTPIYPEEYHIGLVYGATYELFKSHKGYTSKIAIAYKDFEHFKKCLTDYYEREK